MYALLSIVFFFHYFYLHCHSVAGQRNGKRDGMVVAVGVLAMLWIIRSSEMVRLNIAQCTHAYESMVLCVDKIPI